MLTEELRVHRRLVEEITGVPVTCVRPKLAEDDIRVVSSDVTRSEASSDASDDKGMWESIDSFASLAAIGEH